MPDYNEMYYKLFNKITDVIEELQQVQKQSEEIYLESKGLEIITINSKIHDDVENE